MTDRRSGEIADRDMVAELRRWQDSGACWQVISRTRRGVTIGLLRCDGGEEFDRFTSNDPRLLDFIGDRLSSSE